VDALTVLVLAAYAAAAALYLAYHAGLKDPIARAGRTLLMAGFALHLADIAIRCTRLQHPASSTTEAMAFIGWMIAGGYLAATVRYRLHAAGAFAVPAALVLVLLARVVPATGGAPALGSLGLVHVFLATLGVATFALAAVIETLYLVQERRLKRKELARLRSGGAAPLDTLDRLAALCVSIGFPVFTLAILTGALWVARLGILSRGAVRPEYVLAVVSWLAFGVLLVARAGAGWQGRRAAWLTVGGFSGVLLVVVGYFLRAV
jgi:ABC-type uncharacterized transport system permease subunit